MTRLQEEGAVSKAIDPGPDRCSPGPAAPAWTSEAVWRLGPVIASWVTWVSVACALC